MELIGGVRYGFFVFAWVCALYLNGLKHLVLQKGITMDKWDKLLEKLRVRIRHNYQKMDAAIRENDRSMQVYAVGAISELETLQRFSIILEREEDGSFEA